jgi:peptidyl-tRNA hydrolase, PTH1 family
VEIIVGLGNPGDRYKKTRHNVGFMVTGMLAEKYHIDGKMEPRFNSIVGKGVINGKDALILQPLTYMNLSGEAVVKVLNWYKIEPEKLFVVFDDISLDLGRIRFRKSGSDGGHNGVKSIIENLGGFKNFPRLKVGIGPDPGGVVRKDYVLKKFAPDESEILDKIIHICVEGIETYLEYSIEESMNKFNSINLIPPEESAPE